MRRSHGRAAETGVAVAADHGGENLRPRCGHVDHPETDVGEVRQPGPQRVLDLGERRHRDHSGQLGGELVTTGVDASRHRAAVIGTAPVAAVAGQVGRGIARRGGVHHPLAGRPGHGPRHRALGGRLVTTIGAPEHEGVDVVAAVGDVHALEPGPHEATHGVLGVDQAAVVDHLHRREACLRRHADDPDAVAGGSHRAGHVGSVVAEGGAPAPWRGVRSSRVGAVDRGPGVDVGLEVGVVVVDAGVKDPHQHLVGAVSHPMGSIRLDDPHVPLRLLPGIRHHLGLGGVAVLRLDQVGARGARGDGAVPTRCPLPHAGGAGGTDRGNDALPTPHRVAETRPARVGHHDPDLGPGLDHDTTAAPHGPTHVAGVVCPRASGVDDVAAELSTGRLDLHRRRALATLSPAHVACGALGAPLGEPSSTAVSRQRWSRRARVLVRVPPDGPLWVASCVLRFWAEK